MDDKACQAIADMAAAVLSDPGTGALLTRLHAGRSPLVLVGSGGLLQLGVFAAMAVADHTPALLAPGDLLALPVPSTVVLISSRGNEASFHEADALADFLDRGGEVVLLAPAVSPWATLASRKGGRFVFIPFGDEIDVLAEARREIARLQLRLTLYAQGATHSPTGGIEPLTAPPPSFASSQYRAIPLTGSEGRKGRSLVRSLKMVGYALFPFGRRRRLKRRHMMAAIWRQ